MSMMALLLKNKKKDKNIMIDNHFCMFVKRILSVNFLMVLSHFLNFLLESDLSVFVCFFRFSFFEDFEVLMIWLTNKEAMQKNNVKICRIMLSF